MSKPVRIIALLLTVVLVIGAVVGIAVWSASTAEAAAKPGIMINGKLNEEPGTIMKVGDNEISFAEYRYYYLQNKSAMEANYGAAIWEQDVDRSAELYLNEMTRSTIQEMYAWMVIAEEMDIALSDEEKQEVLDTLAEQKESLGVSFQRNLESMFFVSEEQYIQITEMQKLQAKTREELEAQLTTENEATIRDSIVSAQHILIQPLEEAVVDPAGEESSVPSSDASASEVASDASGTASVPASSDVASSEASASQAAASDASATGEEELELEEELSPEEEAARMAQAKIVADELVRQIREAADPAAKFAELRAEYDTDGGQPEEGYTFGEGEMVDEFYQGTLALEIGAISDPIKTSYGYHIIMRQPVDEAYIAENMESLMASALSSRESEKLAEVTEDLPVIEGDNYQYITPTTIQ